MEKQINIPPEIAGVAPEREVFRKVVIRYMNGRLLRGYMDVDDQLTIQGQLSETIFIDSVEGKPVEVRPSEIKAIFFVRSFEGKADYSEFKIFSNRPAGKGVWIRVRFSDGEIIEGVAPNCFDTFSKPVFYMTPPDPVSNNQAVLVSKRFLKEMQVLGLAAD